MTPAFAMLRFDRFLLATISHLPSAAFATVLNLPAADAQCR